MGGAYILEIAITKKLLLNMRNTPIRADYTYSIEGNIIVIVDLDLGNRSVTNDIENVLADIRTDLGSLAGYSVIYRDSMGHWDAVSLVNDVVYFYPLNATEREKALSRFIPLVES
ncbi:hypothetical protein FAES_pFAES01052 (plasmid) [Fibrella aestuarina BUZ 2]|uniref:Uncharacterized protein n=2 Tax=Fibrella TaxID=861914 RepID=I0KHE3_9BACT|nr:hypothetical protein FAES_pFAES01052 [Fibrella aestuarina BUZ 2]